ncbi:MAG: tyrosine-type recombinase/integrase [Pseudolabrys sp.]
MTRKIKDSNLESRTARSRLRVRHKPYFRLIEPGLHLGYRKLVSGPGTWIVRRYIGGGAYTVKNLTTDDRKLVIADDFSDADGVGILSFVQAHGRAKVQRLADASAHRTVASAMDDYIAFLEENRSTAADARYRDRAFIRPELGDVELARLTTENLEAWLKNLAKRPPRLRTGKGEKQKFAKPAGDDESKRRRQASANRTWTVLKAALNRAWRNGKVASNLAWHRVAAFPDGDQVRIAYLSIDEARRLIGACAADFRKIVQAGLLTGARYGQLAGLTAADFDSKNSNVRLRTRKSGGQELVYRVALTREAARFFGQMCAGLGAQNLIFTKDDGAGWGKSHQKRLMGNACKAAKIDPAVGFQQLRHTWAAHAVMNGVPLPLVARNLGYSGTAVVDKRYGHLAPKRRADAIGARAPKFGFKPEPAQPRRRPAASDAHRG